MTVQFIPSNLPPKESKLTQASKLLKIWLSAAAQARESRFEKNLMNAILSSEGPDELRENIKGILPVKQGMDKNFFGRLMNEFNPGGYYTGGLDSGQALALKKMMDPKAIEEDEKLRYGIVPWTEDPRNADNPLAIAERNRRIREAEDEGDEGKEITEIEQAKNYIKQAKKLENEIAGIEGRYQIGNIENVAERYERLESMMREKMKGWGDPNKFVFLSDPKLARQYEGVKLIKTKQAQAELLRQKAKEKMQKNGLSKKLDKETALMILEEAGGNKERAREIARERGYEF